MSSHIHKTALVDAKAHLGERVRVGPFAIIEAGAVLGDDCVVEAHAIVKASARLGNEVSVGHFSVKAVRLFCECLQTTTRRGSLGGRYISWA